MAFDNKSLLAEYLKSVNPQEMAKMYKSEEPQKETAVYPEDSKYPPDIMDAVFFDGEIPEPEVTGPDKGAREQRYNDLVTTLGVPGLISGGPFIKALSGLGLGYNAIAPSIGLPTIGQFGNEAYKFGGSMYTPYENYEELLKAHKNQENAKKESVRKNPVSAGTSSTGKVY